MKLEDDSLLDLIHLEHNEVVDDLDDVAAKEDVIILCSKLLV